MEFNVIPFSKAYSLIQEGDILLFRGQGFVAKAIQITGKGLYSHAALASWSGHILECVEFREWKGGRTVSLLTQAKQFPKLIDVYRVASPQTICQPQWNNGELEIIKKEIVYNGRDVTNTMRQLTGLSYGYKRILWLMAYHAPISRWFIPAEIDDKKEDIYPVCSTAVSAAIRQNYVDLVPFKSDSQMEPSDIARSCMTYYLFTIDANGFKY